MKQCPETYRIVRGMIERGNKPGLIREWMNGIRNWAENNPGPDAAALRNWLSIAKPKPFYSAQELALMWPALKFAVGLADRMMPAPSPERLRRELEFCGLPYLGAGQEYQQRFSRPDKFFIVEQIPHWRKVLPTQKQFEEILYADRG